MITYFAGLFGNWFCGDYYLVTVDGALSCSHLECCNFSGKNVNNRITDSMHCIYDIQHTSQ